MKKDLRNIVIGVILGVLAAWLLGFFHSAPPPADDAVIKTADAPSPIKPGIVAPVAKNTPVPAVVLPTMPPVKASQSTPSPAQRTTMPTEQVPQDNQLRQQSQTKAILNNLRQISSAAQQFMMEKGVTQANYFDIAGYSADYLHNVAPVADEDYTGIYVAQSTTQLTISGSFGTVTFNQ